MNVCKRTTLIALYAVASALSLLAQSPTIEKVEPPNWWAGYTINPVRLLIRGSNLQGAKVRSTKSETTISNLRTNSRGDYLFADVSIANNATPGDYSFTISTQNGETRIPFFIEAPLDAKTNFRGITNDDVIYLIMTDRFADGDQTNNKDVDRKNPRAWHGGDFRGIIDHLDYLKDLGITAIWLTPWYDNADEFNQCDKPWCPNTNYHGYAAIDYYGVENHFGSMADLRELIKQAHAKGIKVIQDQVANHVGIQHPWAKRPPLDNWFSQFTQNTFNNSVLLSPNGSHAERNNLLHGWFNESMPDMNQDEPEVARYEIQNALWWIAATGIDGIRQDTIQYMPRPFIRDWSTAILRQYPNFYMVGEVFERDSAQTAFFQGGKSGWDGIDTKLPSDFDFKLWETSEQVFTGQKPVRALRDVLKYDGLYPNINNITTLTGNHDTDRFMSLKGATLKGAMMHMAFTLTVRGIPQIYYGDEIGMAGGFDPDNRRDFPGGFPGDARSAFRWKDLTADEMTMLGWTKWWIKLRRDISTSPLKTVDLFYDDDVYLFERHPETGGSINQPSSVVIAVNRSAIPRTVQFKGLAETQMSSMSGIDLFLTLIAVDGGSTKMQSDGTFELTLPPRSVTAYEVNRSTTIKEKR